MITLIKRIRGKKTSIKNLLMSLLLRKSRSVKSHNRWISRIKLPANAYKNHFDRLATVINWELYKRFRFDLVVEYYQHWSETDQRLCWKTIRKYFGIFETRTDHHIQSKKSRSNNNVKFWGRLKFVQTTALLESLGILRKVLTIWGNLPSLSLQQ